MGNRSSLSSNLVGLDRQLSQELIAALRATTAGFTNLGSQHSTTVRARLAVQCSLAGRINSQRSN